jgi:hypothetical protein
MRNIMQKGPMRILTSIGVCALLLTACGDEAQQAAEEANRDTVPVIETNKDKDTAVVPGPMDSSGTNSEESK